MPVLRRIVCLFSGMNHAFIFLHIDDFSSFFFHEIHLNPCYLCKKSSYAVPFTCAGILDCNIDPG